MFRIKDEATGSCKKEPELEQYDAVYVCGGDCRHLLNKMQEMKFDELCSRYMENRGVYVGVSAGSCICAANFEDSLLLLPCKLSVHCEAGTSDGSMIFRRWKRFV